MATTETIRREEEMIQISSGKMKLLMVNKSLLSIYLISFKNKLTFKNKKKVTYIYIITLTHNCWVNAQN